MHLLHIKMRYIDFLLLNPTRLKTVNHGLVSREDIRESEAFKETMQLYESHCTNIKKILDEICDVSE